MTKNEIMNDMNFRHQCGKYGLDWGRFEIYDDVILLNAHIAPTKDLYVIFDKNYNTIGIEFLHSTKGKQYLAWEKNNEYCNITSFGYPFENFTLKQIVDIANRIEISETNHKHSLRTKINGELFNRESNEEADYYQLLSYIKFLGEEIKRYFSLSYQWKALGFDAPDIYDYINHLIYQINTSINVCIANNKRPWPVDVLRSIGQNGRDLNLDGLLYDIINLLMRKNGFKIKSGSPDEIEAFDKPNSEPNLSDLSTEILKILDLSDEALKEKKEEIRRKEIEKQLAEVRPELEEDIEDDVEPSARPKQKLKQ